MMLSACSSFFSCSLHILDTVVWKNVCVCVNLKFIWMNVRC